MPHPEDVATTCHQAAAVMREIGDTLRAVGLPGKRKSLVNHAALVEAEGDHAEDHPDDIDLNTLGGVCSDAIEELKRCAELLRTFGLIDESKLARRASEHLGRLHYNILSDTQPIDT